MPQDNTNDFTVSDLPTAGPFPLGGGWTAGDFQNGTGLLGVARPVNYALNQVFLGDGPPSTTAGSQPFQGSGPFPINSDGWTAGDFTSGSGLLGVSPPVVNDVSAGNDEAIVDPTSDDDEDDDESVTDDNGDSEDSWPEDDSSLDYGLATPGDAQFEPVVSTPTLRRQWERANNKPWPKTDDGQNYHAHHQVAKADGGADDLSNIAPMHPDEHIAHHMANDDFSRWAQRRGAVKPIVPLPGLLQLVRPQFVDPYDPEPLPPKLLQIMPNMNRRIIEPEPGDEDT